MLFFILLACSQTLYRDFLHVIDPKTVCTPNEIFSYLKTHKFWPQESKIRKKTEQALAKHSITKQLLWFDDYPPLSIFGKILYVQALSHTDPGQAQKMAKQFWSTIDLTAPERTCFLRVCNKFLTEEDHLKRINYLFFTGNYDEVSFILPHIKNKKARKEIHLRLGIVRNQIIYTQKPLSTLSDGLRYQWVRFCRINRKDDEAYLWLIQSVKDDPAFAEQWWTERNWMARRFIDYAFEHPHKRMLYFKKAFDVITQHSLKSGEKFADACFLRGFLQYKMKNYGSAYKIFAALNDQVKTSMSKSRACYWAGLAAAKAKNGNANLWFGKAAQFPMTFYGQVACLRLKKPLTVINAPHGTWPPHNNVADVLKTFDRNTYRGLIEDFSFAAIEASKTFAEAAAICHFIHKKFDPSIYVKTCKKANMKFGQNPMGHDTLPLLKLPKDLKKTPLEQATIRAIIYRESECDHTAKSNKGALGLMQLIPKTARSMAKMLGIKIKNECDILHPENNIRLGFHNIKHVLKMNKCSYIVALCSYNTDPCNVRTWLQDYGDPCDKSVDVIEWIECIPFYETRSYVIRVLENITNYLVASGNAPIAKALYERERIVSVSKS
jgi:soluble lytic murein transglycosylase